MRKRNNCGNATVAFFALYILTPFLLLFTDARDLFKYLATSGGFSSGHRGQIPEYTNETGFVAQLVHAEVFWVVQGCTGCKNRKFEKTQNFYFLKFCVFAAIYPHKPPPIS